ncbi:MAG: hypothetical protein WD851_18660 [Pirellulales bacterium]
MLQRRAAFRLGANHWVAHLRRGLEVSIGHLQIVTLSDPRTVAEPVVEHVVCELLLKFRSPRAAQRHERLGPRFQSCRTGDRSQPRPQVHFRFAIPRDDKLASLGRYVPQRLQVGPQLGEERHHARILPFVMLRLGRADGDSIRVPIHIAPPQQQNFRRAAHAAEPSQREDEPPLIVGAGRQHLGSIVASDKVILIAIPLGRHALHVGERAFVDQLSPGRVAEKLLGDSAPLPDRLGSEILATGLRIVGIFGLGEPAPPIVRVGWRDRVDQAIRTELVDQVAARIAVEDRSGRFHVVAVVDVVVQKRRERHLAGQRPFG